MQQAILIDFSTLNLATIWPMSIAIIGALIILCIDLASKHLDKSFYIILGVLFLILDFSAVMSYNSEVRGMFDLMYVDGISILSQAIIVLFSGFFMLLYLSKQTFHESEYPEFFALFLFMVAGFQFMVSSDSLILIFVSIETSAMALYTMIAMHNKENAIEAALKYFTMGALSTAFFAFGLMLFYALTGSLELGQISQVLVESNFENYEVILIAVSFILAGLAFKLSLFPFHTWVPDVYQGSPSVLAGFMSIVPKIAAFIVALRFFEIFISVENIWVQGILYLCVILTMTVPNIIALLQQDVKRMLAYSSVSNAGFAMAAILIGTNQATSALFLYWILFAVTNLGAFALLWMSRNKDYHTFESEHQLEKYAGLIKSSPLLACVMGLFFLSLAGLPPFALFWGKMYLLGAAVNSGMIILALIIALNSAIAAFYYLRPIVYMFLKESSYELTYLSNATNVSKIIVSLCAFAIIVSIFMIEPLLSYISYYTQISGF